MHPPTLYSFLISKRAIPLYLITVGILVLLFYGIQLPSSKTITQTLTPPTPIVTGWKSDTNQDYTIQYPADWQVITPAASTTQVKNFTFTVEGKLYAFTAFSGASTAEVSHVDMIQLTTASYGGRNFLRKLWIYQGKPFRIDAVPNEQNATFNSFSMQLPQTNTDYYIGLFDKTMQQLQLPQVAPQPTLEGSHLIQINHQ